MSPPAPTDGIWFDVVEQLPAIASLCRAVRDEHGDLVDLLVVYANQRARAGYTGDRQPTGRLLSELFPPMVENGSFDACLRALATGTSQSGVSWWTDTDRFRRGGYQWWASPIAEDTLLWVARDASAEIRRMGEQRNRFATAFEVAVAGMALVELDGTVSDVNVLLAELLERTPVELLGTPVGELAGTPVEGLELLFRRALEAHSDTVAAELRLPLVSGRWRTVLVTMALVHDIEELPAAVLAHVVDLSERERARHELARAVTHDGLTGLPNRALLTDHLGLLLDGPRRTSTSRLAVIVIDLDNLQVINGSFGHEVGDRLLREVAERLVELAPPGDTVARVGGDEFALVCEIGDADPAAAAEDFHRRIHAALSTPVRLGDHDVVVQASVGVAVPEAAQSPEEVLRNADIALQDAKRSGGSSWSIFDDELRARALGWFAAEAGLRAALASRDIHAYFQPVVDLTTRETVGFEALARWRRGDRVEGPHAVLEVAEATGLVVQLSEAVAEQAIEALAGWCRERPAGAATPWMSFNVSPRQLALPGFVGWLVERCEGAGVPARDVVLEITERTALRAGPGTLQVLDELRSRGYRIAIDDFGTEYSALAYLRSFPVDIVKVDRAFVAPAPHDRRNQALLAAIVQLAGALELEVIAEGIETSAELDTVVQAGCHLGQGFGIARPRQQLAIG